MTVTKPYGKKSVVEDYIRNVGGISSIDDVMDEVTNDADLFMEVDPNTGIDDNYPFRPAINEWVELESACRLRLMFGDPLDASYYCDKADKLEARILSKDPNLQSKVVGHVGVPDPKTYPSNPFGVRIMGNKQPRIDA